MEPVEGLVLRQGLSVCVIAAFDVAAAALLGLDDVGKLPA